jgi:hypothetical protein
MKSRNEESRPARCPEGRLPVRGALCHYKELTCENGRDDGRAKLTLLKRRRCGWLVMAVPLRFGVVQVLRAESLPVNHLIGSI